jgi:hypothetical protein
MSQKLPKLDLGRTEKMPFFLAFVFHPDGTRLFTGSMDRIQQHINNLNYPTCHAACCVARKPFTVPSDLRDGFPFNPELAKAIENSKHVNFDSYHIVGRHSYSAQRVDHITKLNKISQWVDIKHLNRYEVNALCVNDDEEYKEFRFGCLLKQLTERYKYFFVLETRTPKNVIRKPNTGEYHSKLLFSCRHMPHHYIKEFAELDKNDEIQGEVIEKNKRILALEI